MAQSDLDRTPAAAPGISALLPAALAAAFGFAAGARRINDPDYWTHLALGRAFTRSGALRIPEPFLSGPDVSSMPLFAGSEWPFQVTLHAVRSALGDAGVSLTVGILCAVIGAQLAAPLRRQSLGSAASGLLLVAGALFVARFRFVPRPELVGYLLLPVALAQAVRWTRRPGWRPLIALGAVFAVWGLTHVSWTIGAALTAIVLLMRPRMDFWLAQRRWIRIAGALVAALVAFQAARFAASVLSAVKAGGTLFAVTEMRPTWEFPEIAVPFAALVLAGFVAGACGPRSGRAVRLVGTFAAAVIGAIVVRNVALCALAIAVFGVDAIASRERVASARRGKALAAGAGVALATMLVVVIRHRDPPAGFGLDWRWFPRDAAEFVRDHQLPEPVFNSWGVGGFLDWAWDGHPSTFLDGRLASSARLAAHDEMEAATTVEAAVLRHGFRTVLLTPVYGNDGVLVDSIPWFLTDPGWRLVRATDALVFVHVPLPAGVRALEPRDGWQAVLRYSETVSDQSYVQPIHAPFTRAIALFWLGDLPRARAEFDAGARRWPEAAGRYESLRSLLWGTP